MASLATQLLTVSILSLQRQLYHNRGLHLNEPSGRIWWNGSYDYVIVGGGSAGSVLAGRLSANPSVSVLLLEAGGPLNVMTDILPSHHSDDSTWGYRTTRQQNAALGRQGQVFGFPRGRILGGTHTINEVVYSRGNGYLYDDWPTVYGLGSNWTFDALLPYFTASENNTDYGVVTRNPVYHSMAGPLEVSSCPNPDPIFYRWMNTVSAFGLPTNIDFNDGRSQFGATFCQTTQSKTNWTRQTTYSAFIEPNIGRANLHILANAHVTRILLSSSASRLQATGVEFTRNGQTYTVTSTRECIISGGTINSPQILMLSGIGPADHLRQLGVPVRLDLPGVGSSLVDHPSFAMDFLATSRADLGWDVNTYTSLTVENLYSFLVNSWGPLIRYPILQTYIPTGINGDTRIPDGNVYFLLQMVNPNVTAAASGMAGNQDDWINYYRPLAGNDLHVTLTFNNFRPLSRGTIRLASANPTDPPLIDPNLFSVPQDLAAIVRLAQIALKMVESPHMSPYLRYTSPPVPGCPLCPTGTISDCAAYLLCVAQSLTVTSGHPVGTCTMGNATNPMAVLDERMRVRGVSRLRVVDGSVMPDVPNANTNAAVIAIAERGAQWIAEENMA